MTYNIKSLHIHTYMHVKYKSLSIPEHPARWQERELGKEKKEDGSWRSEFTAFNIGKMKYDLGKRASKELPFCGINKFILLPWFVGGWSNFDHHPPMCPRVSITVFSNVSQEKPERGHEVFFLQPQNAL